MTVFYRMTRSNESDLDSIFIVQFIAIKESNLENWLRSKLPLEFEIFSDRKMFSLSNISLYKLYVASFCTYFGTINSLLQGLLYTSFKSDGLLRISCSSPLLRSLSTYYIIGFSFITFRAFVKALSFLVSFTSACDSLYSASCYSSSSCSQFFSNSSKLIFWIGSSKGLFKFFTLSLIGSFYLSVLSVLCFYSFFCCEVLILID